MPLHGLLYWPDPTTAAERGNLPEDFEHEQVTHVIVTL